MQMDKVKKFSAGQEFATEFLITHNEMEVWKALSGDFNPVHTDSKFAQDVGFKNILVYGGILTAKITGIFAMDLPGYGYFEHSISTEFKSPVYIGDKLNAVMKVVYSNDDLGLLRLACSVTRGEVLICVTKMQAGRLPIPT